jgi:hypothetical protein
MDFRPRCVIYKLQHFRSKPVALLERVKVNMEGVVRPELANDLDFGIGRSRLAVNVANGFGDAEAFRLGTTTNPDVIAITDVGCHGFLFRKISMIPAKMKKVQATNSALFANFP